MNKIKNCPFCRQPIRIGVCDIDGNILDYDEAFDPFGKLNYFLEHIKDSNHPCPIAHYKGECLGTYHYDTLELAISVWNNQTVDITEISSF